MNYETLDWDAEAQRLTRAFDLNGECKFVQKRADWTMLKHLDRTPIYTRSDYRFSAGYMPRWRIFTCYTENSQGERPGARLYIDWNGLHNREYVRVTSCDEQAMLLILRGVHHLGLLTPEIETALQVNITAHERMEWLIEHEAMRDVL